MAFINWYCYNLFLEWLIYQGACGYADLRQSGGNYKGFFWKKCLQVAGLTYLGVGLCVFRWSGGTKLPLSSKHVWRIRHCKCNLQLVPMRPFQSWQSYCALGNAYWSRVVLGTYSDCFVGLSDICYVCCLEKEGSELQRKTVRMQLEVLRSMWENFAEYLSAEEICHE